MSLKERIGKVFGRHPPARERDIEKRTQAVEAKTTKNAQEVQQVTEAWWSEVRRADDTLRARDRARSR